MERDVIVEEAACQRADNPIGVDEPPALEEVERLCSKAIDGEVLTRDEIVSLLEIRPNSDQARVLGHAHELLAKRGNGGIGYIYGQIGIDANPCPGNCQFCSFALCNRDDREVREVPFEQIAHVSGLFADEGVHLISVMSSAAYRFDRYLELIALIRETIGGNVAIMANTRDLSPSEAEALAQAGANCIYHAVRIGEGTITGLDEERRWETLRNAREAGLDVASAIGPLYQPEPLGSPYRQAKGDIAKRMLQVVEWEPLCSGVTTLHAVAGTKMAHVQPWPREVMRVLGGVFQLVARDTVHHGGCQSIRWVDAGLDPRERGYGSGDERLRKRIRELHDGLEADGWRVAPADGMAYR